MSAHCIISSADDVIRRCTLEGQIVLVVVHDLTMVDLLVIRMANVERLRQMGRDRVWDSSAVCVNYK